MEYIETHTGLGLGSNTHTNTQPHTNSNTHTNSYCPLLVIVIEGLKQNIMKLKTIPSTSHANTNAMSSNNHMMTSGSITHSLMYNNNNNNTNNTTNNKNKHKKKKYYWEMPHVPNPMTHTHGTNIPHHLIMGQKDPKNLEKDPEKEYCWGVLCSSSPRLEYNMILYCFEELYGDFNIV